MVGIARAASGRASGANLTIFTLTFALTFAVTFTCHPPGPTLAHLRPYASTSPFFPPAVACSPAALGGRPEQFEPLDPCVVVMHAANAIDLPPGASSSSGTPEAVPVTLG